MARRLLLPEKTPEALERQWKGHVRKIKRPRKGEFPQAEGHALRMVVRVSYECECGLKLGVEK
jgi:hypothetical protein